MDRLYEITLLFALLVGPIALALALLGRARSPHALGTAPWTLRAAIAAWAVLLVSVTVHLRWGHTPGGPQALPPLAFVREHRSFIVAALIPGLALVARRRAPGPGRQTRP